MLFTCILVYQEGCTPNQLVLKDQQKDQREEVKSPSMFPPYPLATPNNIKNHKKKKTTIKIQVEFLIVTL